MSKNSRIVPASLRVAMAASELITLWKHHVIAIRPTQLTDYSSISSCTPSAVTVSGYSRHNMIAAIETK